MGLRNRASLKRCSEEPSAKASARVTKDRASRRTALKRVAVKLVSSDPALADFLKSQKHDLAGAAASRTLQSPEAIASDKVEKAIQTLGKLEAAVIEALFPTSGAEPETFEALATRLGMTIEEVKGVADNALRGLRGSRTGVLRISTVWN